MCTSVISLPLFLACWVNEMFSFGHDTQLYSNGWRNGCAVILFKRKKVSSVINSDM